MSDLSGQRVTASGKVAPMLMVRYQCPECQGQRVLDAYDGPPVHKGCPTAKRDVFMVPMGLITGGESQ